MRTRQPGLARLRARLGRLHDRIVELFARLGSQRGMIPPSSLNFVGDGSFVGIGREFRRYFIELAGLEPDDRVLDVGCGIGRMAIPLTDYLSPSGEYQGFDIVRTGIDWCQDHITPRFHNFHFRHVDIHNKTYNPQGETRARDFRFPYRDASFDVVVLTSVFTHMLPPDLENYLREVARVLAPGGRCLVTFFLLNRESEAFLRAGSSVIDFRHPVDGCLASDENEPEAALAYQEARVRELYLQNGLRIVEPIHDGSWCGRDRFLSFQDIVVAAKG